MKNLFLAVFIANVLIANAQQHDNGLLEKLLQENAALFSVVLNDSAKKQVQILYTQIDRGKRNRPHFTSYSYHLDDDHYFYPASTVKLAACIFALEKINELKIPGLNSKTIMITDSVWPGQTKVMPETISSIDYPCVEHYIKKILLVSDNDAFNRLFEFIGRAEINAKLKRYGLNKSRILNRLSVKDGGENAKHTNPIDFYDTGKIVYSQPAQYDPKDYPLELTNTIMGKGYLDSSDQLVNKPFELSGRNAFPLADQQELMKRLMFPKAFPKEQRFNLRPDDYLLLWRYMSMYPTESRFPTYDTNEYFPTYGKFLFYGADKNAVLMPDTYLFNKIGDSYGFMIDNLYFFDQKNKVEFLLAAVVQSNDDGIYNDDKYEYQTVCLPFLKNLGQVIYQYELKRKKKRLPKPIFGEAKITFKLE